MIGISPGLGLKPGQLPDLIDSSMISYAVASENDTGVPGADGYVAGRNSWIKRTEEFLKTYSDPKEACVSGGETKPGSCFDLIHLGPCGEKPYGYDQGKPCVYLTLKKIYYYEVTFRHSGKSTQNGFHLISHKWYLKNFWMLTNPDLQKS